MRLGVFGGSFNPVHLGHLALARHASSELNLDHLFFVPVNRSPFKASQFLIPADIRIKLLTKALRHDPGFSVSDCEIKRGGISYTVDTLEYFSKQYGARAILYFLTGADSLARLARWKSPGRIFKLSRFVAVTRPAFRWRETGFPVIRLPFEALPVSSSMIRARIKKNERIDDLVPQGMASIVEKAIIAASSWAKRSAVEGTGAKLDSSARLRLGRNDKEGKRPGTQKKYKKKETRHRNTKKD